ncbi:Mitochondrial oxaloacetate carrier protein [Lunasporangiospora selenospora]|uniref:Mitochondrial oxaloacetate carrier protein n=1 Tax=Lunasporangiospora selenospora TaxID=979761 RepID=A0A9P6FU61_9FUNG|nr:Mitochondrial oxaloacetate carrier protein [Lunasporangiospora selenospora]
MSSSPMQAPTIMPSSTSATTASSITQPLPTQPPTMSRTAQPTPATVVVRKPSAVLGFIAGGIAACGAVTITNPAEAFIHIARHEGIRGIQRGLGSAYLYQILMNGTRLGLYDPIKHSIHQLLKTDPSQNNNLVNVAAGGTGGVLSAFLASPLYLVKTRLQSYTSHEASRVGHQHIYKHTPDALQSIYRAEGLRGLYRGVDASMMRTGVGSSVQLPLYDIVKQKLIKVAGLENGALCHGLSSLISGFFLCVVMNPFDIVTTRMYNQATDPSTGRGGSLYKTPIDCLIKTVRTEGVSALYKGFTAHYLRVG